MEAITKPHCTMMTNINTNESRKTEDIRKAASPFVALRLPGGFPLGGGCEANTSLAFQCERIGC